MDIRSYNRDAWNREVEGGQNRWSQPVSPEIIARAKQGEFSKAIKIFEKYIKLEVEQKNLYRRFYFYVGALYMFKKISKETVKLKLPQKVAFFNTENTYNTKVLRDWFDHETDLIAAIFNKRNENEMMSDEKKNLLAV